MIKLEKGRFLRVRSNSGHTVTAHSGMVWITEPANPRDVMLRPEQSFTLSRPGLALIEAVSDASLTVEQ